MQRKHRTVPNDLSQLAEYPELRRLVGLAAVNIENSGLRHNFNFSRKQVEWLTIQLRFTVKGNRNRAQATWRAPDNMLRLRLTRLIPNDYSALGDRLRNLSQLKSYDLSNPSMFDQADTHLCTHLIDNNQSQIEGENSRIKVTFDQLAFEEGKHRVDDNIALARHIRAIRFEFSPQHPDFFHTVVFNCVDPEHGEFTTDVRVPVGSIDPESSSLSTMGSMFASQMRYNNDEGRANGYTQWTQMKTARFLMEGYDPQSGKTFFTNLSQSNFQENFTHSSNPVQETDRDEYSDDEFSPSSNWGLLANR